MAHRFLNTHWVPMPAIMKSVTSFVEKEFKGHYVIGLQLRSAYLRGDYKRSFIDCGLQLERERDPGDKRPVCWFLSSDSSAVLNDTKNAILGNSNQKDKVVFAEGKTGHVVREDGVYPRILFDLEVLARSDALVVTGGSTYGFVALIKVGSLEGHYRIDFHANSTVEKCERVSLSRPGETPLGHFAIRR